MTATATQSIDQADGTRHELHSTATIIDGILDITVTRARIGRMGETLSAGEIVDQDGGRAQPGDEQRLQALAKSMFDES